jgi:hypothetical protein
MVVLDLAEKGRYEMLMGYLYRLCCLRWRRRGQTEVKPLTAEESV